MQATEKYSDRRRNERSHENRRSEARRSQTRLNCSFEVSVLDYEGKTVNVSACGVYFEVTTNDIETFPPGTSIPLQINAVTNTPEGRERKLKLSGRGTVIRN